MTDPVVLGYTLLWFGALAVVAWLVMYGRRRR